jgi:hypothetical protein
MLGLLFFVFVLAVFLGFELIAKVPSQLHTPLNVGIQRDLSASRSSARWWPPASPRAACWSRCSAPSPSRRR